jgi:hypothetical protein
VAAELRAQSDASKEVTTRQSTSVRALDLSGAGRSNKLKGASATAGDDGGAGGVGESKESGGSSDECVLVALVCAVGH